MSLQFYLGRSGSGKTTKIMDEIKQQLIADPLGDPIIYIAPDQMSFQIEKELINHEDIVGMIRAQVYSFSRLAWLIMSETGGAKRMHISKVGAHMLLRLILDEHKEQLQVFHKAADKTGFIENLDKIFTEYKRYCLEPAQLFEAAIYEESISLRSKLNDLALVYHKFTDVMQATYVDAEDHFQILAEKIPFSTYLQKATIYIDGFHGFTPLEKNIIEQLIKHCQKVTVSLTLDKPYQHIGPEPYELFRMAGDTYYGLYSMAKDQGISVDKDIIFDEQQRFRGSASLAHLEQKFTVRPVATFKQEADITLIHANSRRLEIETIAQQILRLARSGHRFNDMIVLLRNGDQYHHLIDSIFQDYQIPVFIDQKQMMLHHPLIELVKAVLEVVESNFGFEPVFRTLKTELFLNNDRPLNSQREEIAQLENYVISRGIHGTKWREDWVFKFHKGLELEKTMQSDEELAHQRMLNSLRAEIYFPLQSLVEAMKAAETIADYVTALYKLLEELRVAEKLVTMIEDQEEKGELLLAKKNKQAWSGIVGLLDQLVEICGEQTVSFSTFGAMVESGIDALKFSLVPPTLDQVVIGNIDSSKPLHVKFAFIIGLNEGVLPKRISESGILTEDDRAKLAAHRIKLAPSAEIQLYDEEFIAYTTFALASEHIYFSYPIADDEGKTLLPSSYIKRIKDIFPTLHEVYATNDFFAQSEQQQLTAITQSHTTLKYLVKQMRGLQKEQKITDMWWAVYNEYMNDTAKKDAAVFVLSSLFYQNISDKLSKAVVTGLYGDKIMGSVSRIEMFNRCPFSYFSRYGLQLKERPVYQLASPDLGTFFHESIKLVADELVANNLSWSDLDAVKSEALAELAADRIAPFLQNELLFSSARMRFMKRKYTDIIKKTTAALHLQAAQSEFTPIGFEIPFGTADAKIPPIQIQLANGKSMELIGRIDRVDWATNYHNGQNYLAVIDYKSSKKTINYSEVFNGTSLQMFTYLDVATKHSAKLLMPDMFPAGMLYFHLHNPMLQDAESFKTELDLEKVWLKKYKMNGLLTDDFDVLQMLDTTLNDQASSDVIPITIKNDGDFKWYSKVATNEQMKTLTSHVSDIFQTSGNKILDGNTAISPYQLKKQTGCSYCEYKSICQFDKTLPENKYREFEPLSIKDAVEKIQIGGKLNE